MGGEGRADERAVEGVELDSRRVAERDDALTDVGHLSDQRKHIRRGLQVDLHSTH